MDQIKFYMGHRRVPDFLQDRVKRWADYSWSRTQAIDEGSLLEMLPERLRSEIAIHIHLDILKKVKIFEECEEGLLHELVLKLRSQIYSPGDFICRTGEIGREMYIINHGKVEILVNNASAPGGKMVVATLSEGNYFGEISLLKLDSGQNKRTADVRSVGYSELLCLSRKDLMTALVEYPDAKKILEAQARERMEKNKEVRRTNTVESAGGTKPATPSADPPSASSSKPDTPTKVPSFAGRKQSSLFSIFKSEDFQRMLGVSRSPDLMLLDRFNKDGDGHVAIRCLRTEEQGDPVRRVKNTHPSLLLGQSSGKELTQIKFAMNEARNYENQMTRQRVQALAERCDKLNETIRQRDNQLQLALVRMANIEDSIRLRRKRKGFKKMDESRRYDQLIQEIEKRIKNQSTLDSLMVPAVSFDEESAIEPMIEVREPTPESGDHDIDFEEGVLILENELEQEGFLGFIEDDRSATSSILFTDDNTSHDSVNSDEDSDQD